MSVLTPRVQYLESQQLATTNALNGLKQSVQAVGAAAAVPGLNFLAQPEIVWNNTTTGTIPWTTYASTQVPSTAQAVLLQVYSERDTGVTNSTQYVFGRASEGLPGIVIAQTIWGTTSGIDITGSLAQIFCPCSGGSFDWRADHGYVSLIMTLIGYFG